MNHRRPRELIVTHLHPDHVGLAGWFARELHAPLRMSRTEYLHCRILVADTGRPAPPEGIEFYRAAGMDDASLERYRKDFGGFGRMVAPLPESYHRLVDGDELQVGDHVWSVVVGCGHSPEHVCLYDRGRNIMLSGDQLLPKISSNVGVWPTEPDANPLDDWLRSCRKLKETIDDETLVCPAHGELFVGGAWPSAGSDRRPRPKARGADGGSDEIDAGDRCRPGHVRSCRARRPKSASRSVRPSRT